MVVVYSGDRERPDRWWDEEAGPSRSLLLDADTPVPPDPALSTRELRPPPVARFAEPESPGAEGDPASVKQFSTMIPPAGSATDTSETEAPVALSSAARALPLPLHGAMRISEPPRPSEADLLRIKRERASTVRRAAVIIVGAFLSAYFVTQRVASRRNEAARASAEKAAQLVARKASSAEAAAVAAASPQLSATIAAAQPDSALAEPSSVSASAAEEPRPAASAVDAAAQVEGPSLPTAPPGKRAVVIEVVPWDAKVLLAGVAQPGPPFVVMIPEGRRVAFEVARRGYIPRRVVVDGSEPRLSVGLVRPRGARGEVPPPPPRPSEGEAEEGPKDSRLRVRSGL